MSINLNCVDHNSRLETVRQNKNITYLFRRLGVRFFK